MKTITLIALLGCAFPALADRLPMPANAPASFKAECSSCHIAYQPALLAANDWKKIMTGLNDHFGSDATVDRKKARKSKHFWSAMQAMPNAWAPPAIRRV